VESDGNVEVGTREFPPNCENALAALNGKIMMKIQDSHISGQSMTLGRQTGATGGQLLQQVQLQRRDFNECIEVRRLVRVVMSYCQLLRGDV
jgi:hypothetical protein